MITVFERSATDFTTNGLGTVEPIYCKVHEVENGDYDLELEHPIDDLGKYLRLQRGNIIVAPVPGGMTPYVHLPEREIKGETSERGVWRFVGSSSLRKGPDTIYKYIAGPYHGGDKVAVVATNYTAILTNTTTGTVERKYYYAYPTDPVPSGWTRVIQVWYRVVAPDGVTGWTQGGISNVYRSESVETIAAEVVEEKQIRNQPFRIKRVVPAMGGTIKVYAKHLTYDLLENEVIDYTPGENDCVADVLRGIGDACESKHEFNFYCDNADDPGDWKAEGINNPLELIMGDGGFVDTFGGEIARDWFDFYVVQRIGKDKPELELRQRKNLLAAQYDVDDTNVTTRLTPYGTDSDGSMLLLDEKHVDSPYIDLYDHPLYQKLEVKDAKVGNGVSRAQALQMLRDAADKAFADGCDLPAATLDINFINLYDTEEYKDFAFIQNIYLGDGISVVIPDFELKVLMRMTEYTYDCLLRRYESVSFGTVGATMADTTVTSRQLANGAVTGRALAVGSVGSMALGSAAVTNAKMAAAAIGTANIQNAAITEALIGNASITNAKMAEAAIGRANIQDAAVNSAKIANLAVTSAKLGTAAVTEAKIHDAAISTAKIQEGAITTALIGLGVITSAHIMDASITAAKIVSLNADVITTGTLSVKRLILVGDDGLIYEINAAASGLTPQQLTDDEYKEHLNGTVIVAKSITAAQIAAETITAHEIATGTLTSEQINTFELFASDAFIDTLHTTDLTANESLRITLTNVQDVAGNAYDAARGAMDVTNNVSAYMTFMVEGLRQRKPGSPYSTLIDNVGFHIDKDDTVGHIASFTGTDGLTTGQMRIGNIKCRATSAGGWVWQGGVIDAQS